MDFVKAGDNVLIIWNKDVEHNITNLANEIKDATQGGSVLLENSEMIREGGREHSSFDIVLSNWLPPYTVQHTDELLAIIIKVLKPSGKFILKDNTDLTTNLKLNGFINITKDENNVYTSEKPKFEVGSKARLNLNSKAGNVWKLDSTVEEVWKGANDDDIIDENQLLEEEDLKKPNQDSLRVCATTGKRKACADCSCGLAEELRGEVKETPKSSCGSCYLGDAFRCATCPYLGMPAFKPGEKILLDLNSDV